MKKEEAEQLLRKYLDNTLTPAEREKVDQLYQQMLEEDGWKLEGADQFAAGKQLQQKLEQRLDIRINSPMAAEGFYEPDTPEKQQPVIPLIRRPFVRYAAAAAAIIIGISSWFLITKQNMAKPVAKAPVSTLPEFAPGGNKAVLTLSDGSTIILDSASNGLLSHQGGVEIVKLANGEIAYRGKGAVTQQVLFNTMSTPRGGQYQLSLPDGTRVWLNAASSITYPTVFTGHERNVTIRGEAYFEVAKNQKMPFHVSANDVRVTVVGTHFNINSYEDESAVRTTLLEGSVKIQTSADSAMLQPGQQAAAPYAGRQHKIELVPRPNVEQVMAWKNGYFNFKQADLPAFMRQLERWYDIEVKYEGPIPVRVFQGKLQRELNLSEIMSVLERLKIKYRFEGRRLIVSQ